MCQGVHLASCDRGIIQAQKEHNKWLGKVPRAPDENIGRGVKMCQSLGVGVQFVKVLPALTTHMQSDGAVHH